MPVTSCVPESWAVPAQSDASLAKVVSVSVRAIAIPISFATCPACAGTIHRRKEIPVVSAWPALLVTCVMLRSGASARCRALRAKAAGGLGKETAKTISSVTCQVCAVMILQRLVSLVASALPAPMI